LTKLTVLVSFRSRGQKKKKGRRGPKKRNGQLPEAIPCSSRKKGGRLTNRPGVPYPKVGVAKRSKTEKGPLRGSGKYFFLTFWSREVGRGEVNYHDPQPDKKQRARQGGVLGRPTLRFQPSVVVGKTVGRGNGYGEKKKKMDVGLVKRRHAGISPMEQKEKKKRRACEAVQQ